LDGKVSEAEFLVFMLRSFGEVDDDILIHIRAQFKEMDVTGDGMLDIDDIDTLLANKDK